MPTTYTSKTAQAAGYTLTKETGATHNPFGEAVQLKRVRNVVDHEGNAQGLYSVEHPTLRVSKHGSKRAEVPRYASSLVAFSLIQRP